MTQLNHTKRKSLTRLCGVIVLFVGYCYLQLDKSKRTQQNALIAIQQTKPDSGASGGNRLSGEFPGTTKKKVEQTDMAELRNVVVRGAASILYTSNLRLKKLSNRSKEKKTVDTAKGEALRVMFKIEAHNILRGDDKQLYIRVVGPDGIVLNDKTDPLDTLVNAEGKAVTYSAMKEIELTPVEMTKEVSIDLDNDNDYEKGNYQIEIYNDGYKVGSGSVTLQ